MKKTAWQPLPEPFDKDFRYFLVVVWRHLRCRIRHQCS